VVVVSHRPRPDGWGSVDAQHLLEDPHTVIQGDRVLHLRYRFGTEPCSRGNPVRC
jgi:hypothetical protein